MKLKSFSLAAQPTSGGLNFNIVRHDICITSAMPLSEVVSSSTGSGSNSA